MGKLLDKYTQPDKTVEFNFPLSNDKLNFRRPSVGDIKNLQTFISAMDGDEDTDLKMSAKILKTLCPALSEESEAGLKKDILELEAPDRAAIVPFYFELLGITEDDILDQVNRNLSTTTRN